MIYEELNQEDISWTTEPIQGIVLMGAVHDSYRNPIKSNEFYKVGNHKPSKFLIIIPYLPVIPDIICLN